MANHRAGLPAGIKMKANAIVDEATIDALYRASMAGVPDRSAWGAWHLRVAPGVPRTLGHDSGAFDPGSILGAQSDLLVRWRRRAGCLHRVCRPHAPRLWIAASGGTWSRSLVAPSGPHQRPDGDQLPRARRLGELHADGESIRRAGAGTSAEPFDDLQELLIAGITGIVERGNC